MFEGGSHILGVLWCRWPGFSEASDSSGVLLSQMGTRLALELWWDVALVPHGTWKMGCDSGELRWRTGPKIGNRGGDLEAPLYQMLDAALPNGSVLSMHCEGHGCRKLRCGRPMVRRPGPK